MDHYPLEEIPSRSSRSDGRPYLIIISLDGGLIGWKTLSDYHQS